MVPGVVLVLASVSVPSHLLAQSDAGIETSDAGAGPDTQPTVDGAATPHSADADSPDPGPTLTDVVESWHLADSAPETVEAATAAHDRMAEIVGGLQKRLDRYKSNVEGFRAGAESLREQVDNPALPDDAKETLRAEVAVRAARLHREEGRKAGLAELLARAERAKSTLDAEVEQLEADSEPTARSQDEQRRVEEARKAEQQALEQLERTRNERQQERNREIKQLIAEQSEVLTKVAEVAREQSRQIQSVGMRRNSVEDAFESRREEIDEKVANFPKIPTGEEARGKVDPVFRTVRRYLEEARNDYTAQLEDLRAAMADRTAAEQQLEQAESKLARVRSRTAAAGDSEVARRKIQVAEAELEHQRRLRDKARDVVAARKKTLELHDERIQHWNDVSEEVLPRLSRQARHEFFSPWKSENWESVEASLREARRYVSQMVNLRLEQLESLDQRLYSAEFWGWVFGLLWRLAVAPLAIVVVRQFGGRLFRWGMDAMLHRPFFRRHAAGALKFGELVRALVWPAVLFATVSLVVDYLAATFPEARVLAWGVDLGFVYWVVLDLLKVLVLPRHYRAKKSALAPAPELGRVSERSAPYGHDVVDVVPLDLAQAKRLVRTGRHILTFTLAAWAVPLLCAELLGHNVLWRFIENAFDLAVLGIVYVELSIWRDDIASIFRDLTETRMPGAAEFVERHKDRVYGIAIIAAASVYVVIAETIELGRRYLVDTALSRSIANFIFRKKVELQQTERDQGASGEQTEVLPDEYLDRFRDRPLVDEDYLVERPAAMGPIVDEWESWLEVPRQGSITLSGEKGVGKSTLLNRAYRYFLEDDRAADIRYTAPITKIASVDDLLPFLTELFDLEQVPDTRDEMVDRILDKPPTVVLLDDCHHFFLRQIEGFEALSALFDLVTLTDHHHFWVLAFNKYGWRYIERVQDRKHFFGATYEMPTWSPDELKEMVDRRNETSSYSVSYTDLVLTGDERRESSYEVVKTANGYFRLLQDFCEGNASVALDFWCRNLSYDGGETLQVNLFKRPSLRDLSSEITDDHLFALTALVQHGSLTPREVGAIINVKSGFCQMALDYFAESGIAERNIGTGRYELTPLYFRPVIGRLTNSNFLWR